MTRRSSVCAILAVVFSLSAQQTSTSDSWLDRSLENWNRQGKSFPGVPVPLIQAGEAALASRCREQVRQPASAAEKAVVRKGWTLFGPVQTYGPTAVFMAMAGIDGMCRPMGYQAFLYSEGRYAGTLSPAPMNSRADGSLSNIRLISSTSVMADFARYGESDPLCCPARTTTVSYEVKKHEIPDLTAVNVATVAACQTTERAGGGDVSEASVLFGRRWTLIEIGEQRVSADKPYIEFDGQRRRASGDGGCNRFAGEFMVTGASLKISQLVSTKRACAAAEANRLETNFLRALEETTRYEVREKTLRLYMNDRLVLIFTRP